VPLWAINNTGVSILEQGHVRDAQKTFRESLILMKQACSNPTAAACEQSEEALQSASARLVRAQNTPVHVVFEICAIEDGDTLNNTIKSALFATVLPLLRFSPFAFALLLLGNTMVRIKCR
jgi:hypothetical protein